ncbi:MAG: sodium/solute symporter [Candidatus Omnitrophica bacterium]|nr:sodium/solute symporter [Candidatus Omnitrophota bacterium]
MDTSPHAGVSFHWLDGLIIFAYLMALAGIGYYHSRKQKDLKDFFLAGKSMKWIPVGVSLMAALNSGMDYLMQPSGVLKFGIVLIVVNFSWFILYPYVFYITLPLFRRLDVFSAYEYLERRFDVRVRSLTAGIFMLWRLSWMATALYVPCLAITTATGHPDWLYPTIVLLGTLVTFYVMMGGITAVIWTDVTQFCIMFGGLAITILVILANVDGGFSAIMANATVVGDTSYQNPVSEASSFFGKAYGYLFIPLPILGFFWAGLLSRITTYTSDQVMVQRFQTSKTIRDARSGFVITAIGDVIWMTVLIFVGVALFTYFEQQGGIPSWIREGNSEDQIFPYFMGAVFPAGLTGLVIAAIFAASLSSIDSAINSLTSVAMVDFYQRIYKGRKREETNPSEEEQRRQVRVSRTITLIIGAIGIFLSCNVSRLGTILEIANKLINGFTGPILGIFFMGMFTKSVNARSALVGGICGTLMAIYVMFWSSPQLLADMGIAGLFPGGEPISSIWPSTFGFFGSLLIGLGVSFLFPATEPEEAQGEEWNWFSVTRTPLVED